MEERWQCDATLATGSRGSTNVSDILHNPFLYKHVFRQPPCKLFEDGDILDVVEAPQRIDAKNQKSQRKNL
jgi:hypothetical protein